MRVTTSVAASLHEGEVIGVLNGLGEFLNGFGQQMSVIGNIHFLRNLRFGSLANV